MYFVVELSRCSGGSIHRIKKLLNVHYVGREEQPPEPIQFNSEKIDRQFTILHVLLVLHG